MVSVVLRRSLLPSKNMSFVISDDPGQDHDSVHKVQELINLLNLLT